MSTLNGNKWEWYIYLRIYHKNLPNEWDNYQYTYLPYPIPIQCLTEGFGWGNFSANGQEWADSHFGSVRHCFKAGAADFRRFWFSLIIRIKVTHPPPNDTFHPQEKRDPLKIEGWNEAHHHHLRRCFSYFFRYFGLYNMLKSFCTTWSAWWSADMSRCGCWYDVHIYSALF